MALWRRLCLVLCIWLAIIATVILSVLDYEAIRQAFWEVDDDLEIRGAQKLRLKLRAEEKSHEVSGTKLHMVAHGGTWWRVVARGGGGGGGGGTEGSFNVAPHHHHHHHHHPTPPPHRPTTSPAVGRIGRERTHESQAQ